MKRRFLAFAAALSVGLSLATVCTVSAADYNCKTVYPTYHYANPTDQYTLQLRVSGCYDGSSAWGTAKPTIYAHTDYKNGVGYVAWNPSYTSGWSQNGTYVNFWLNSGSFFPRENLYASNGSLSCYDGAGGSGYQFGCTKQ